MQAYIHGGKCCGIKHIQGLDYDPNAMLSAKRRGKKLSNEGSCYMNSTRPFFYESAPAETYLQRFDRIIAFIKTNRPKGVIEVVISDFQLVNWRPLIEERGFNLVTKAKNSNSGQTIHIYHLITE